MSAHLKKLSLEPLIRRWESCPDDGSKYQRLAGAFSACMRSGDYAPGDHLPSETEICAALPVGLSTVQKALAELVGEGMVVRRRKLGSFIADRSHQVPEVHVYRFRDPASDELLMPFTRVLGVRRVRAAEYGPLLTEFSAGLKAPKYFTGHRITASCGRISASASPAFAMTRARICCRDGRAQGSTSRRRMSA